MKDKLLAKQILSLSNYPKKLLNKVKIYESLPSTNTEAKLFSGTKNKDRFIFLADEQTEGKGRMGKSFFCEKGKGIYMSLVLTPLLNSEKLQLITVIAALAVSETIKTLYGIEPKIKWVNDVLINNKKVCGILSESILNSENSKIEFLVVGIGLNVFYNESDFPDELKKVATSLNIESNITITRNIIISQIVKSFFENYEILLNTPEKIIEKYKSLLININKNVTVLSKPFYNAVALGIDNNGSLIVKNENGEIVHVNSGEVSVKL